VCSKSPQACELDFKKRAPIPSRNQPSSSSLSHAVPENRPFAEPTSKSNTSASSNGVRVSSHRPRSSGNNPHDRGPCGKVSNRSRFKRTATLCCDHRSRRYANRERAGATFERDSSHELRVRIIRIRGFYRVIPQCVAFRGELSSNGRETLIGAFTRCLDPRGPDNGKPVERPGRKATRLQRKKPRHASRAAERSSRRDT
jgi:hypothetical protein